VSTRGRRRRENEAVARRRVERLGVAARGGWVPTRPQVGDMASSLTTVVSAVQDRVPPGLRSATVSPGRQGAAGLLLLAVTAVVVALVGLWLALPGEQPVQPRRTPIGHPLQGNGPTGATTTPVAENRAADRAGPLLVHVAGAVRQPGLVELAAGARVGDAVAAAGGARRRADPASVNLARPVVDGEQIVVLRRGEPARALPGAVGPAVAGQAGPSSGPVDLNVATLDELDALPGIGPVLAQRIVDWRTAHGRFSTVDELGEVSGIGEATLAELRPVVTV